MRTTSAASLLVVATLAAAATLDIPRSRATTNGTAGCGTLHIFNGITQYHSLTSSGVERDWSIHLPSTYDENIRKNPLPHLLISRQMCRHLLTFCSKMLKLTRLPENVKMDRSLINVTNFRTFLEQFLQNETNGQ
ncbi:hypothetical protein K438DRAFT_1260822 [Mycena galopus ATCC 62051]|nr:hypothetical protein K438DRAFT_1260822 [Mycena galopus ATCC 62051]